MAPARKPSSTRTPPAPPPPPPRITTPPPRPTPVAPVAGRSAAKGAIVFIGLVIMLLFAVGVYRFANSRFNDDPAVASSATSEKSTPSRMIKDDSNFVRIPAGEFMMGSEYGSNDERPVHQVKISRDFELGRYEVTQAAVGNREGK